MEINQIKSKRIPQEKRKSIRLNLCMTPACAKWIKEMNLSPNSIFQKACEELGFKQEVAKE